MMTKKEYIFIFCTLPILLGIFTYLLYGKIEYYYIFMLSLGTGTILKGIYDIKYRTGNQDFYHHDEKTNQKVRYVVLCATLILYIMMVDVIYKKLLIQ